MVARPFSHLFPLRPLEGHPGVFGEGLGEMNGVRVCLRQPKIKNDPLAFQ